MPKLTVTAGPDAGRQFDLTEAATTVGRHSSNAIALHDHRVSRKHMELRRAATGGFQLYDLDSGNGTVVNGRTIRVIDLRDGDRIEIGDSVLRFETGPGSGAGTDGDRSEQLRLVVQSGRELPSAVFRTVAADAGSELLRRPESVTTEWLRTRLANLAVMYEAANAVSQILDVDELLNRVLELVLRSTDADHGCALLRDPDTGDLTPKAVQSGRRGGAAEFVVSRTVTDHVLRSGEGVLIADAAADDRFKGGESVAKHRLREVICVPMRGRHDTVGVLFLDTRETTLRPADDRDATAAHGPMRFSEDHLRLAVAVAHQAALAVEETRHYRALLQAERLAAVGQTIAGLSHHIKNIMQGVRFGSDMVRTGMAEDDKELLSKGWRLVEKNQTRIDELILDMLSYSKDREPGHEPADLNAIAADVLDVVRGRAIDRGVSLDWAPGALPPVECDPDGIHRAVLNVVSNAVDAADGRDPARVAVETRLTADGRFAEVVVTDTGPGVPANNVNDIFKPFLSTKGARGTGLGLPVSRKILLEHAGDVTVESAVGHGATFTVRLPVTAATTSPASGRPPERP